jgi:uncharacterized membrane protein HdeD (DUF308 family)
MQQNVSRGLGGGMLGVMRSIAVISGILLIILGFSLVTAPGLTTLAVIQFLGIYWLVLGVISIIQIFTGSRVHWGWLLLTGVLGILAGFLVLQHPMFGAFATLAFLVYFIALTGFLRGAISIVQGIAGEGAWNVILGVILVVISFYMLFNPFSALVALPIVIGIFSLIGGVSLVVSGATVGSGLYSQSDLGPKPS